MKAYLALAYDFYLLQIIHFIVVLWLCFLESFSDVYKRIAHAATSSVQVVLVFGLKFSSHSVCFLETLATHKPSVTSVRCFVIYQKEPLVEGSEDPEVVLSLPQIKIPKPESMDTSDLYTNAWY